ncbi:unnamed protein product, partial [Musa acuminata subsp. burmannicoides]
MLRLAYGLRRRFFFVVPLWNPVSVLTANPSSRSSSPLRLLVAAVASFCAVSSRLPSSSSSLFVGRWPQTHHFLGRMERLWTSGSLGRNKELVERLQLYGIIKSKKVAEVMEAIDRGLFVPPGSAPYVDTPILIGYNATISAPHMHAACLELLREHLQPGMRALDVGSGTGYLTACFAMMLGPEGRALGVEHIAELVDFSINNIKNSAASSFLKEGSLSMHIAERLFFYISNSYPLSSWYISTFFKQECSFYIHILKDDSIA